MCGGEGNDRGEREGRGVVAGRWKMAEERKSERKEEKGGERERR